MTPYLFVGSNNISYLCTRIVSSHFRPVGVPTGFIFRVYYKFSINLC